MCNLGNGGFIGKVLGCVTLLLATGLGSLASAQEPSPANGAAVDPKVVMLHLMDGSVLAGKLSIDAIDVQTSFGTLKVPVESLKRFVPGLASKPQLNQRILKLIDNLGSAEYAEREAANGELRSMGEAVRPILTKYVADGDKERRDRVKNLLEELDESNDEDSADPQTAWFNQQDTVETTEFTAVGRILTTEFTIESKYGPLNIKLSDLRRCERNTGEPQRQEKSLSVDEQNLVQRTLKDTGIRVEKGDTISVSAEGTIKMTPWGSNAFATPEGANNFGWLVPGSISGGALVATIGNNNQYIRLGSKASIRAPRGGVLRLGIAMQPEHAANGNQFPGNYQVKVVVEKR